LAITAAELCAAAVDDAIDFVTSLIADDAASASDNNASAFDEATATLEATLANDSATL
jgi:hypothetical protein